MTKIKNAPSPIINDNLKNVVPFGKKGQQNNISSLKTANESDAKDISPKANQLNQNTKNPIEETLPPIEDNGPSPIENAPEKIQSTAQKVASSLAKIPTLPIAIPVKNESVEKKIADVKSDSTPLPLIEKPLVVFIEGFSPFGFSNGNGIKDMADNYPEARLFRWSDKDQIHDLINKHHPREPLVLVGHSFGADTAIEVANELNTPKNHFRSVDLIVSLDSVGINKTVIPVNVKKNLNYFVQGVIPFLHGDPTVARNNKYTEVINELIEGLHSKIDDNPEIQFEIFKSIDQILNPEESFEEIQIELEAPELIAPLLKFLTTKDAN